MKRGRQRKKRTSSRRPSGPSETGMPHFDRRAGAGLAQRLMTCKLSETMARQPIASGTVHRTPADFRNAIEFDAIVTEVWASITPLARNEWICRVTAAKKGETRTAAYKSESIRCKKARAYRVVALDVLIAEIVRSSERSLSAPVSRHAYVANLPVSLSPALTARLPMCSTQG